MKYIANIEDKSFEVDIIETDDKLIIRLDGQPVMVDFVQIKPPNLFSFLVDNQSFDVEIVKNEEGYWVNFNGRRYECVLEDEKIQRIKDIAGFNPISKRAFSRLDSFSTPYIFFCFSFRVSPIPLSTRMFLFSDLTSRRFKSKVILFDSSGTIIPSQIILGTTPNIAPPSILKELSTIE